MTLLEIELEKELVEKQDSSFRPHLGASLIGESCERKLWFSFRWAMKREFEGRMLRLFDRGHMEENRFIKYLRMIPGVTVLDRDPETNRQFHVSAVYNHFQGSMDGVAFGLPDNSNTWHVMEYKTHSNKSFTDLVDKGVEKSKPYHFAQMQCYAYLNDIPAACYIAVNKNNDQWHVEYIKKDDSFAKQQIQKAEKIIFSTVPLDRAASNISSFGCRFCDYKYLCFGEVFPHMNCRTCVYSVPSKEEKGKTGYWTCQKDGDIMKCMKDGCEQHIFIPDFFHHSYFKGQNNHSMEYQHQVSGEHWINNPGGEIKNFPDVPF